MAMLHRALFTWFLLLVFLILLALRLDERTQWNWLIVFIPMWFYDAILLIYINIHMINQCRTAGGHHHNSNQRLSAIVRRVWNLIAVVLKLAFMVALCLRLNSDGQNTIPTYFVLLPLWILVTGLCFDVFYCLILQHQYNFP